MLKGIGNKNRNPEYMLVYSITNLSGFKNPESFLKKSKSYLFVGLLQLIRGNFIYQFIRKTTIRIEQVRSIDTLH